MKIAAQTVLWGNQVEHLEQVLRTLSGFGIEGIELAQRPDQLGSALDLRELLKEHDIRLLSLAGGTIQERIRFCADILRPEYLYIEDWDDSACPAAIAAGFKLALHPHLYKRVHRLVDAAKLLNEHKDLLFLPDTAHLTIAGDSIEKAVTDWLVRLAGIHVKDWTPVYGRSSHRYARGFVELGAGIVKLSKLFESLRDAQYDGWIVIEQARPDMPPELALKCATNWLKPYIGQRRKTPTTPAGSQSEKSESTSRSKIGNYSTQDENKFLEAIFSITTDEAEDCYVKLTQALGQLTKSELVLLCVCNPPANMMGIIGVYPSIKIPKRFMDYGGSLSNVAVERQTATLFDLSLEQPAAKHSYPNAKFGYPSLIKAHNLRWVLSVPVLNPMNPHQSRFVVNFFASEKHVLADEKNFLNLSNLLAKAADAVLDERCAVAGATVNFLAGQCQQADAFLEEIKKMVVATLRCEALTIFLVNDIGDRLEVAKSTGIKWNSSNSEEFYLSSEDWDDVVKVWQNREPILSKGQRTDGPKSKSEETISTHTSCLCAPLLDVTGTVIGVIRCRNKHGDSETFHMFSDDDLAVLDAVCQAAVPHLQVLLSKERRAKALRRLTHEFNTPLVAIAGAADRVRQELVRRYGTCETFFKEDYIGDIDAWVGLMRGLSGNADFFRLLNSQPVLEQKRVKLYGDVFMPAANQMGALLKDRDFDRNHIYISPFEEVPTLWLDKKLMIQVVFNLLTNAIKYADDDPNKFQIRIGSRQSKNCYEISISDFGPGIPREMEKAIFLEGVRLREAEQRHVSGDGLGLWVARRALLAHGADIELTSPKGPTTFTIFLPKWLGFRPAIKSDSKLQI